MLRPTWIENGIDVMFPIEYSNWKADIKKLREKYGKAVRGVGGMNKGGLRPELRRGRRRGRTAARPRGAGRLHSLPPTI